MGRMVRVMAAMGTPTPLLAGDGPCTSWGTAWPARVLQAASLAASLSSERNCTRATLPHSSTLAVVSGASTGHAERGYCRAHTRCDHPGAESALMHLLATLSAFACHSHVISAEAEEINYSKLKQWVVGGGGKFSSREVERGRAA